MYDGDYEGFRVYLEILYFFLFSEVKFDDFKSINSFKYMAHNLTTVIVSFY